MSDLGDLVRVRVDFAPHNVLPPINRPLTPAEARFMELHWLIIAIGRDAVDADVGVIWEDAAVTLSGVYVPLLRDLHAQGLLGLDVMTYTEFAACQPETQPATHKTYVHAVCNQIWQLGYTCQLQPLTRRPMP